MNRRRSLFLGFLGLTTIAGVGALGVLRLGDAPRVATGFVASILCSDTFVSGLAPDRVLSDTMTAMPGVGLIRWGIATDIDRDHKQVTATLFGGATSRAIYRDGLGCLLAHEGNPADASMPDGETWPQAILPQIAGPALVDPSNPHLRIALDQAFAETNGTPLRNTKAIVIVKDGRVVAERYAPGYRVDTPILGFSATKSVINALIGILVREGKLSLDQPAPVALWQGANDPRHAITVDHLLRHTSGLALGSSLSTSLASAFAPVNRIKYVMRDLAGFAESASLETTPGSHWNYHDGNTVILSRILRDAAGGHAADVLRLARRELFGPLGMHDVTLEFDATGTPEGSSQMLATARDWARFGMLYLDDGIVAGQRILPQGWVHYSAIPTPDAFVGYGAGFWTNLGDSEGARRRIAMGMPAETIHARGIFGQYVIIVPSERLVIVRLGISPGDGDAAGVSRLVKDAIVATRPHDS
jgi:CubicO group peptidase (beta-lactamase class C family)